MNRYEEIGVDGESHGDVLINLDYVLRAKKCLFNDEYTDINMIDNVSFTIKYSLINFESDMNLKK